jgi:hypothetical protein
VIAALCVVGCPAESYSIGSRRHVSSEAPDVDCVRSEGGRKEVRTSLVDLSQNRFGFRRYRGSEAPEAFCGEDGAVKQRCHS